MSLTKQAALVAAYRPGESIYALAARYRVTPSRAVEVLNLAGVAVVALEYHRYRLYRVSTSLTRQIGRREERFA